MPADLPAMPPSSPAEEAVPPPPSAQESPGGGRILGVDLARCFAIMGMVLVNYRLRMGGWRGEPKWLVEAMGYVNSRAAATFVLLAGISLTLLYRSRVGRDAPRRGWRGLTGSIALVLLLATSWVAVDFYAQEGAAGRRVSFGPLAGQERFRSNDDEEKKEAVAPLAERFQDHLVALSEGDLSLFLKVGAGVSSALLLLLLVLGRRANGPRGIILKRVVFLAAIGFAWYPLWTWDILHYYAVYLLAGAVLLGLKPRWLALIALAVFAGALWDTYDRAMGPGRSPFEARDRNTWSFANMGRSTFLQGIHPVLPWLCFLLVGLIVGRLRLDLWSRKLGLLAVGLVLAAAGYLGNDHVHGWLKEDRAPDEKVHHDDLELVVAEKRNRPETSDRRTGNRNARRGSRGRRPTTTNDKKDAKPQKPPEPDPLPLEIPPDFDRVAHADFLEGAEELRTLLAPRPRTNPAQRSGRGREGRERRDESRRLRVALLERDGKTRPAVVMALAFDAKKPVPRDHERRLRSIKWSVRGWVRNARYVRLTGDTGPEPDEEANEDAPDEAEGAEEKREVKLWPESVGLFAIERRLRAQSKPKDKSEASEPDGGETDEDSPSPEEAVEGQANEGQGEAPDEVSNSNAEAKNDAGKARTEKPLPGEVVHWDTHWIDAKALGNPTPRGVLAGWFDPDGRGGRPKFVISATGVSLTVLALALILMSFGFLRRWLRPLTTAGEVALTLYVAHVIIGFYPLRWIDKVRGEDIPFITFYVVNAWIVLIALANWWRAYFKRGPLEALMRWMTG